MASSFYGLVRALVLSMSLLSPIVGYTKDNCQRDDQVWHDKLQGYNPGGIKFNFESRVQKYSSTAFQYIWCIENKSDTIGHFLWGTRDTENKYFDALVSPGEMEPTIRSDSSGTLKDKRVIKFTPKNTTDWRHVDPDPETIFNRRSGKLLVPKNESFQLVQIDLEQRLNDFKTVDGLIDLVKLSQDSSLFRQFVEKEGKIEFSYIAVATLPTNETTLAALEQNKYEKYNPSDFARLRIVVNNQILLGAGGFPTSRINILMTPTRPNEEAGLAGASKLPLTISVSSSVPNLPIPKELILQQRITPRFSKLLLEQPAGSLLLAGVLMTIRSEKMRLFTFPIDLLTPGQRS